jgi:hypothetical protein
LVLISSSQAQMQQHTGCCYHQALLNAGLRCVPSSYDLAVHLLLFACAAHLQAPAENVSAQFEFEHRKLDEAEVRALIYKEVREKCNHLLQWPCHLHHAMRQLDNQ